MAKYKVAKAHMKPGSIETGRPPVIEWVADERYGTFASSVAAKRAFTESLFPECRGLSDAQIRAYFDRQARSSMAQAKVIRVRGE